MTTSMRHHRIGEYRRVLRFLIVGASGTALDVALFIVLKALGLPTLTANVLAYGAGIANNFGWNRYWTYADARGKSLATQFWQFALVSFMGLALNSGTVLLTEALLAATAADATSSGLGAKIAATGVSMVWNYVANRYWTFNGVQA